MKKVHYRREKKVSYQDRLTEDDHSDRRGKERGKAKGSRGEKGKKKGYRSEIREEYVKA